jgi:hypothetical protein
VVVEIDNDRHAGHADGAMAADFSLESLERLAKSLRGLNELNTPSLGCALVRAGARMAAGLRKAVTFTSIRSPPAHPPVAFAADACHSFAALSPGPSIVRQRPVQALDTPSPRPSRSARCEPVGQRRVPSPGWWPARLPHRYSRWTPLMWPRQPEVGNNVGR